MSLHLIDQPDVRVSRYRQYTYQLRWVPARHYVPGTEIELRTATKKGYLSWQWTRMDADYVDITWREPEDWRGMRWDNLDHVLMRAQLTYELWEDHAVTIWLTVHPGTIAEVRPRIQLWTKDWTANPEEVFDFVWELGSEVELRARAGPAEYLYLIPRPAPEADASGADGSIRTALVPEDAFSNPTAYREPVTVAVEWDGQTYEQIVTSATVFSLPAPTQATSVLRPTASVPVSDLAHDESIRNADLVDGRLSLTGAPVWYREGAQLPMFGALHWHSEHSGDGSRPIEDALLAGRDTLNLDFISSADHHPTREGWDATVEALEAINEPGSFATLFGWEGASDRGHCNFYLTDPQHPLRPHGEVDLIDPAMFGRKGGDVNQNMRPNDYLYRLEGTDFLVIPHHTNASGGKYWRPFPWAQPTPLVRLVEILQGRGNMEFDAGDDAWRSHYQFGGGSVRQALAKGFRFGFNGGTDNHSGWPGRLNHKVVGDGPHNVILTGVWAAARTREAVFEGLYRRATWVTWGTRAIVDFRVNDVPAGSDLVVPVGSSLQATIAIAAEDALWRLELVSQGEIIWQGRSEFADVDLAIDLGPIGSDCYLYLRAMQRNGALIYASPVFVSVADAPD